MEILEFRITIYMFGKQDPILTLSDTDLLIRFQKKADMRIVGEFYKRYAHLVMGTCMKYLQNRQEAEDLTMHVFEILPDKIGRHQIIHFKSWLHIVVKNECLMRLRKKTHHSHIDELHIPVNQESEEGEDLDFNIEQLEKAMSLLKDDQRKCIELFFIDNRSYKQIADELVIPVGAVKSYIQNGKRNLRIQLERNHVRQTEQ